MRSIITIVIILAVFLITWFYIRSRGTNLDAPKDKPIAESKHSKGFNSSIASSMESYYILAEGFVNWDSVAVKNQAQVLRKRLDSLSLDELKNDPPGIAETAIAFVTEAKTDADSLVANNGILKQREWLNTLTQNLYDFLRTVKYDQSKLYLQQCPMAFNETEPGVWLSRTAAIRNPYMGLHHPRYGKGMIECGETKDTLSFILTK